MSLVSRCIRSLWPALALAALPVVAHAAILVQDDFSYPDGPLVGQGGWQAHSGAGAKPVQVASGSITLQQSAGSGEDVNKRWFTAQPATATTYASFHLTIAGGQAILGTDYFAHFRPAPTDTNSFVARVFVSPGSDAGHYLLGIASGSATATPVVNWSSPLAVDTEYLVVTSYDAVTGDARLWVDPSDESSTSVVSTGVAGTLGKTLESYAFRQASPSGATYSETIGDTAVGTVFADVTGGAVAAQPTTWGRIKAIYR